jgi:class 3 adenylate cyclase
MPTPALGPSSPAIRALLLCDLVASTHLVERLGDAAAAELMARHDRIARELLAAHGGREIELGTGDVEAIRQWFRSDRRVAAAVQLLFLRSCGRPMDRFSALPRNLLRYVAEALEAPPLTIASLRSLYERRPTLYEHQQWARDYLDLRDLDPAAEAALMAMLTLHAAEAAHTDELVTPACHWLYGT